MPSFITDFYALYLIYDIVKYDLTGYNNNIILLEKTHKYFDTFDPS